MHPILIVFVQKTDKFQFTANGMRTTCGWRSAGSQSHPHIRAFGSQTIRCARVCKASDEKCLQNLCKKRKPTKNSTKLFILCVGVHWNEKMKIQDLTGLFFSQITPLIMNDLSIHTNFSSGIIFT